MAYHVVKHTFVTVHDLPDGYEAAEFHLAENRCSANVVNELAAVNAVNDEYSVCNICRYHSAEYLGEFTSIEEARRHGYDLSPERHRALLAIRFPDREVPPEDGERKP